MSKWLTSAWMVLITLLILTSIRYWDPTPVQRLRLLNFDGYQALLDKTTSDKIVLYDIGEKELKDETLSEKIKTTKIPLLLLLNKIDLTEQEKVAEQIDHWKAKVPNAEILPISALNKFNLEKILERILELLPMP